MHNSWAKLASDFSIEDAVVPHASWAGLAEEAVQSLSSDAESGEGPDPDVEPDLHGSGAGETVKDMHIVGAEDPCEEVASHRAQQSFPSSLRTAALSLQPLLRRFCKADDATSQVGDIGGDGLGSDNEASDDGAEFLNGGPEAPANCQEGEASERLALVVVQPASAIDTPSFSELWLELALPTARVMT